VLCEVVAHTHVGVGLDSYYDLSLPPESDPVFQQTCFHCSHTSLSKLVSLLFFFLLFLLEMR